MDRELEQLVWNRAGGVCEYCRFPSEITEAPFQIDHVTSRKHGGMTAADNLALACFYCNSYKGSDIAGIDPASGRIVRLFHPRKDRWSDHFSWTGPTLTGRTAIGRATIHVLWINHPLAVETRRLARDFFDIA
jgi:hypothetical protein